MSEVNSGNVPIPHKVSIKVESTKGGKRIHVHCYGDDPDEVAKLNVKCFEAQKRELEGKGYWLEKETKPE